MHTQRADSLDVDVIGLTCRRARAARVAREERAFTLVEVLMAVLVLTIGVLGTLTLVDRANVTTASTKAREGGTNVARELVEVARTIAYEELRPDTIEATLRTKAGGTDTNGSAAGFTVVRRDVQYTVVPAVCSIDEPRDRVGSHVAGGFCPNTPATDLVRPDRDPEDYKRVTVDVTWRKEGTTRTSRQTAVIASPGNAAGVSVTALDPDPAAVTTDSSGNVVVTGDGPIAFSVATSRPPQVVEWSVDGADRGDATGSGTAWSFSWAVSSLEDGAYLVGAQASDAFGRTAGPRFLTVTVNRSRPAAPTGFAGGRNGSVIDLAWNANLESDVIGYTVSRLSGGVEEAVTGCQLVSAVTCRDASPPAGDVTYVLRAYDRDPSTGAARAGDAATTIVPATAVAGNNPPTAPANLTGTATATSASLSWSASSDKDTGDSVAFYRIYRDGGAYTTTTLTSYTDPDTGGASHTYYVTAVDTHFLESAASNSVTLAPPGYTP